MATSGATRLPANVVPTPLSPLVGRERELAAARDALQPPGCRLLTLTGPGGVGKTRLALAVAADLIPHFADGVAFVPLASLHDPVFVLPAIARALGVWDAAGATPEERLRIALRSAHLLLVLDNVEHLLPAAPALADLLAACPGVSVLATGRAPLRLSGERVLPVPPLSLPAAGATKAEIAATDAVRLFIERVRAVRPGFAVTDANATAVAAVCRRLDGLPLAIELAAPRLGVLSPSALADRLAQRLRWLDSGPRDLPARQQTMRDAIAWSYDLLNEEEQALFRRLAVFTGGFTLDAAEALGCRLSGNSLALVTSVVEQNLLRPEEGLDGEPRFGMLETIREFGLEQLAERCEEAAARDAHARYLLRLAKETEADWYGPGFDACMRRWSLEHANLRAALGWLEQTGAVDEGLELAAALTFFWYYHGPVGEGLEWLSRLLARSDGTPTAVRAKALEWAGHLAGKQGDVERAAGFAAEAVQAARACGDRRLLAFTLCSLGGHLREQRQAARTRPLFEEALALFQALGLEEFSAVPLLNLGLLAADEGEADRATALGEEALRLRLKHGNEAGAAIVRHALADMARGRGDRVTAVALYRENLAVYRRLADSGGSADSVVGIALAVAERTPAARVVRMLAAAARPREATGAVVHGALRMDHDALLARLQTDLGEAAFAAAWDAGHALSVEQVVAEALGETLPITPPEANAATNLTPRERDVLRLLVEGRGDKEIAAELAMRPKTAGAHVSSIMDKLGVESRTAAAVLAVRHGLI